MADAHSYAELNEQTCTLYYRFHSDKLIGSFAKAILDWKSDYF